MPEILAFISIAINRVTTTNREYNEKEVRIAIVDENEQGGELIVQSFQLTKFLKRVLSANRNI